MKLSNWNGRPKINATLYAFDGKLPDKTYTPRGNGRNYGDAGLNDWIVDMTTHREVLELDENVLHASAGFTLKDLLQFIVPKGYFWPVIPGTQHVTLGGMIAADVHGKNHTSNGTIGRWITSLNVRLPNGSNVHCSAEENSALFQATIGGLGLTGIIISAKINLIPLKGTRFIQKTTECTNLDSLLRALKNSTSEYAAGWFNGYRMDSFMCIEHDTDPTDLSPGFQLQKPRVNIPFRSLPFVQPFVMKWYNKRYAKRALDTDRKSVRMEDVFFPLDRIGNWNYLYGQQGFYQLQFTFSESDAASKIERILASIQQSKFLPTLVVVKHHGTLKSPGMLSYPTPGFSFAFDFRYQKGLSDFLQQLNKQIADMDGRVYLVKDALLDSETFEKMYPEAEAFRKVLPQFNGGRIASLLSKRINLTP